MNDMFEKSRKFYKSLSSFTVSHTLSRHFLLLQLAITPPYLFVRSSTLVFLVYACVCMYVGWHGCA